MTPAAIDGESVEINDELASRICALGQRRSPALSWSARHRGSHVRISSWAKVSSPRRRVRGPLCDFATSICRVVEFRSVCVAISLSWRGRRHMIPIRWTKWSTLNERQRCHRIRIGIFIEMLLLISCYTCGVSAVIFCHYFQGTVIFLQESITSDI